ncbi:hypothetical protein LINGRAHAP2_LOCUS18059 [Linum grandiflorum]
MKWFMDEDGLPVAIDLSLVQVQTILRNPIFQFERPPPNESKMICLGELNLNLHTLQDLYFGMQKHNRKLSRQFSLWAPIKLQGRMVLRVPFTVNIGSIFIMTCARQFVASL